MTTQHFSSGLPWQAEQRVTQDQAAELAREAFGIACRSVRALGEGWDYINFLADDQWVLRFPKRAPCADVLVREKSILDRLNQVSLPTAIPNLQHLSAPLAGFAWHFAAYRYIEGTPLINLDPQVARGLAPSLGRFLSTIHRVSMNMTLEDPWDMGDHDDWKRREFEASIDAYSPQARARIERFLDLPAPAPPDLPAVFTHADFNAEHILVDASSGTLTGVIDWADAHTSIRSTDFIGLRYWAGQEAVETAYAAADYVPVEGEWAWLEYMATAMCIGQVFYGWKDDKPHYVEQALKRIPTRL